MFSPVPWQLKWVKIAYNLSVPKLTLHYDTFFILRSRARAKRYLSGLT